MNNINIIKIVRQFATIFENQNTRVVGRWNLKDNQDIKGNFANMDCCGDSLCGYPDNYSKFTKSVLKKKEHK